MRKSLILTLFAFSSAVVLIILLWKDNHRIRTAQLEFLGMKATLNVEEYIALRKHNPDSPILGMVQEELILDALRLFTVLESKQKISDEKMSHYSAILKKIVTTLRENPRLVRSVPEGELWMLDDPFLGKTLHKKRILEKCMVVYGNEK